MDLASIRPHQAALAQLVDTHGAILFRGFQIAGTEVFERIVDAAVAGNWVEYREAATPRMSVSRHVSTSTEYPAQLRIYVHNENSHVTSWPLYLFFYCRTASAEGATPLADCRAVQRRLPASIVATFEAKGWLYRRNFLTTSSSPWTKVFGTSQIADVEEYCRLNYMTPDWHDRGLTIRYRRWATLRHPRTGDPVWFNHGTFFNRYTLEPVIRQALQTTGDEQLAANTYVGDGMPVPEEVMRTLDEAYQAETTALPWQPGDVLMLDNMRLAHGRQPYRGKREVYVAMKCQVHCSQVAAAHLYSH